MTKTQLQQLFKQLFHYTAMLYVEKAVNSKGYRVNDVLEYWGWTRERFENVIMGHGTDADIKWLSEHYALNPILLRRHVSYDDITSIIISGELCRFPACAKATGFPAWPRFRGQDDKPFECDVANGAIL